MKRRRNAFPVTALGILWGIAVSAMESVTLPLHEESVDSFASLMLGQIVVWSSIGVAFAWSVDWAGARLRDPVLLVGALLIGGLTFSAVASMLLAAVGGLVPSIGVPTVFPNGRAYFASFLYQTWLILFYGGFYVLARIFGQRAESTRGVLEEAQIARIKSETSLNDAELRALQGRVDPRFLGRVMHELDRRYRSAPETANRLMSLLVDMLRQAMPGVRTGRSTLGAEIALARAYCALKVDLAPDEPAWSIEVTNPPADVPFPAMLFLPLIDRLSARQEAARRAQITVRAADGSLTVDFFRKGISAAAYVSDDDLYRIRVALSTLFADRWSLDAGGPVRDTGPALRITLRFASSFNEMPAPPRRTFAA